MKRVEKNTASKKPTSGGSQWSLDAVIASLKRLASARVLDDMGSRYGILTDKAFGVPMGAMLKLAKEVGRDHDLALALWKTGWYEARMVACMIDDPEQITATQMDAWCKDFDNWGICDTVCFKLFDQVDAKLAFSKVTKWARMKGEFQKRGGFALLACVALHRKEVNDTEFLQFLALIEQGAMDERNFVMKGVSWALRSVGRRGPALRKAAMELAGRMAKSGDAPARWIGKDALKDLAKAGAKKKAGG